MNKQFSPFAVLTGAEKQIKWLEYQSIRLPYIEGDMDRHPQNEACIEQKASESKPKEMPQKAEIPQPPPEIPRVMPDFSKTRHSQYDAVIARLKQAELQTGHFHTMS